MGVWVPVSLYPTQLVTEFNGFQFSTEHLVFRHGFLEDGNDDLDRNRRSILWRLVSLKESDDVYDYDDVKDDDDDADDRDDD